MAVLTFTTNNFEQEVLKSDKTVLVDFWASWCGPCRMFSPIVDQAADELEGVAKVGKVNVDEEPELARRYGIMSIPTLMAFKNGQVVDKVMGVQGKESVLAMGRK
ncbi:thioredoxin [Angelakisella massiliensis]|uniref:thioredoxin n=1 Tax=Angelakisella massiliensis TaxID=1871018 RepID=UPI0008F8A637|nr:thioredoxin [Angelakisella massiliensis]